MGRNFHQLAIDNYRLDLVVVLHLWIVDRCFEECTTFQWRAPQTPRSKNGEDGEHLVGVVREEILTIKNPNPKIFRPVPLAMRTKVMNECTLILAFEAQLTIGILREMFHRVDHCNHFRGTLEAEEKSLTKINKNQLGTGRR